MISGAAADQVFAFEARSMGSALRIHVRGLGHGPGAPDDPAAAARAAWSAVLAEFDAVDRSLSRFRADSELTALNRRAGTGTVLPVSHRLRTALATVHRAERMTGGRFDARVLGALEHLGERGAGLAADSSPRSGSGAPPGGATPDTVTAGGTRHRLVTVPAQPLDMGGIGKGLALRWAAEAARVALPPPAGGAPAADGWMVGIEDPAAEPGPDPAPLAVVAVHDGAVATSSIRVRRWVSPDGRPVHHLVDPRTGEPARTGLIAVTVASADPAWAEVWSKALFLAGRTAIGDEARSRDLAAWWVDDGGALGMTPAARTRSAWVAEDRLGGPLRQGDGAD